MSKGGSSSKLGLILGILCLVGLVVGVIVGVVLLTNQKGTECEHEIITLKSVQPTCTKAGLTEGSCCAICGEVFTPQQDIEKLPHVYGAEYSYDENHHWQECVCGERFEVVDHQLTWVIIAEETEEDEGLKMGSCFCGYEQYESIPKKPHVHEYTTAITPPNCTQKGYTTYTCRCGNYYNDNYVDALGHDYCEWYETKPSTCQESGTARRDCQFEGCEHFETKTLAKLKHDYEQEIVLPTCTQTGHTVYTCSCGESYVGNRQDALVHNYGEWYETKQSTCQQSGERRRDCIRSGCNHFEVEEIEKLAHDYIAEVTPPSCERGYTTYTCSCGHSYIDNYVEAVGHDYENGVCQTCGAPEPGSYLYLGEYPQSIKADNVSISSTTNDKGYYLGSDNCWYAKVTAKPYDYNYTFTNGANILYRETYYFKVEPIKWQVISTEGERVSLLCASIIESRRFSGNSNNYIESEIREWLNGEFYNNAFSTSQKQSILTTFVDNSIYSMGYGPNQNDSDEGTLDKIYLLSYQEACLMDSTTVGGSKARIRVATDYARANGAYMNTTQGYLGNGKWWLRSSNLNSTELVRIVNHVGNLYYDEIASCDYVGIVPALQIKM